MHARIAVVLGLAWLPLAHAGENTAGPVLEEGLAAYARGYDAKTAAHFRRAAESGAALRLTGLL